MNKTVSLETAKLLKEAGFPQEGDFWWASELCTCKHCNKGQHQVLKQGNTDGVIALAVTEEQIRAALPDDAEILKHACTEKCSPEYRRDELRYAQSKSKNVATYNTMFKNDADLLAELYLNLKKQNLL